MSLSVAIPVIVAADVAIVALVAFVMSRAALLTPHHGAVTTVEPTVARRADERLPRRASRSAASVEHRRAATPQPARS